MEMFLVPHTSIESHPVSRTVFTSGFPYRKKKQQTLANKCDCAIKLRCATTSQKVNSYAKHQCSFDKLESGDGSTGEFRSVFLVLFIVGLRTSENGARRRRHLCGREDFSA